MMTKNLSMNAGVRILAMFLAVMWACDQNANKGNGAQKTADTSQSTGTNTLTTSATLTATSSATSTDTSSATSTDKTGIPSQGAGSSNPGLQSILNGQGGTNSQSFNSLISLISQPGALQNLAQIFSKLQPNGGTAASGGPNDAQWSAIVGFLNGLNNGGTGTLTSTASITSTSTQTGVHLAADTASQINVSVGVVNESYRLVTISNKSDVLASIYLPMVMDVSSRQTLVVSALINDLAAKDPTAFKKLIDSKAVLVNVPAVLDPQFLKGLLEYVDSFLNVGSVYFLASL